MKFIFGAVPSDGYRIGTSLFRSLKVFFTSSHEMMRELDAHILDARMDESVHVLLLTGAGEKFFCAGADIAMLEKANPYFKHNGAL